MQFKLFFSGFGRVGKAFANLIINSAKFLKSKYGIDIKVVCISDIKYGSIVNEDGIELSYVIKYLESNKTFKGLNGYVKKDVLSLLDSVDANLLIEVTWSNLETGEPALSYILKGMDRGMDVITTNKGPFAVAYREVMEKAEECDVFVRFEGTVMSGTPVISLVSESIAGANIYEMYGILNGTTNFILTQMFNGKSFEEALEEAKKLGYAEADPTADIEAIDPAAKVAILANVAFDDDYSIKDVERVGIRGISELDIKKALEKGMKIKLLAKISCDELWVKPVEIDKYNPLHNVDFALNAILIKTKNLGDIFLTGPGAGPLETAQALLEDLIAIARLRVC